MSGPKKNLAEGWRLIRTSQKGTTALILDDPTGPDRYLGCKHCLSSGSTTWQESYPSDGDSTNHPPKN
eukprot:11587174-Prorocentrum_lima.AAC.1